MMSVALARTTCLHGHWKHANAMSAIDKVGKSTQRHFVVGGLCETRVQETDRGGKTCRSDNESTIGLVLSVCVFVHVVVVVIVVLLVVVVVVVVVVVEVVVVVVVVFVVVVVVEVVVVVVVVAAVVVVLVVVLVLVRECVVREW